VTRQAKDKGYSLIVPANMEIWFLPPYSPKLNPIERLWKFIKHEVLHNRLYESLNQQKKAVIDFFDTLSDGCLSMLCICLYI
jgi:transposase